MSQIGAKLAKQLQNRCLPASYAQYTNCSAHLLAWVIGPTGITTAREASAVPACDSRSPATPCYTLVPDASPCAAGEFLVQLDDASGLAPGTLIEFVCR